LAGVQLSCWVVLGALSVLRSNALNTGQDAVRAMLGTVAGFIVGAALLAGIGTNTTLLWFLLPLAVFLAGVAPAVISFAGGQAAFTLTLVILFNIIQPTGWRVGLVRIEDVAIGVGVSLVVGLRLEADAVLDLWRGDAGQAGGDVAAAGHEILGTAERVTGWYDGLATTMITGGELPRPLAHDKAADGRLVRAVRRDLLGDDGRASATAVRMIWTGDHLDVVRRLQAAIISPARATAGQ